ncbi:MAG: TIR domain-containing protein [Candidatus Electrothrix sp. AX5]|nr:TIR domain-containing protein [Candidatus Electrothrix sp. AX5]
MVRVFISYKSEDYEFANFLNSELNKLPGVTCDFDETLRLKGVNQITDIISHGTVVNFIIPILTKEFVNSRACMTELKNALAMNLKISTIGSVIPIVYDDRFDMKADLPNEIENYPALEIHKKDFIKFKREQIEKIERGNGKSIFKNLEELATRVTVNPLSENYLRFDHTFWDFYESLLDIMKKYTIEASENKAIISIKNIRNRTEEEIPLTFYGPIDLIGYKIMRLHLINTSKCSFDVWGDKMMKIILNNNILIPPHKYQSSDNQDYCIQTQENIDFKLPSKKSLFNKICIIIAPGKISDFEFAISFH